MIEFIHRYIISIVCGAILCVIVNSITSEKSLHGIVIRLLLSVFMVICAITPFYNFKLPDISGYINSYKDEAEVYVNEGKNVTHSQIKSSIKKMSEEYILDKGAALKANISVDVSLSNDEIPIPEQIIISGDVSPYAKSQLSTIIYEDLGIPKERQVWM